MKRKIFKIVAYWFFWSFILILYQQIVTNRFFLKKPDTALSWTVFETQEYSWNNRPYLLKDFLNQHVAWDSEFYLAIADKGYDNDLVRVAGGRGQEYSLNYAFFPLYPLMIRVFYYPFIFLEKLRILSHIEVLVLSGVVVSLLGTLLGFISFYLFLRNYFSDSEAFRGIFYFSIFPSAFFMGEVYTEGLFCGLFFLSLLLVVKKKRWLSAVSTSLLFLTRPAGLMMIFFMLLEWLDFKEFINDLKSGNFIKKLTEFIPVLLPVLVFLIWKFSPLGYRFEFVQFSFFGRQGINILDSLRNWKDALFLVLFGGNMPTRIYYSIEFLIMIIAILSFFIEAKKFLSLSILGLVLFLFSFFSGVAQGMHRYLLFTPTIFTMLMKTGKNEVLDRVWSILSILIFGMLSLLFSFDMWAG
ncbi:MAG: mannosyltransferase family protein [Brevinematia bacterium]